GGGPDGGQARPRAPPPQPTAVRTVQLRIVTRMRRATCIVSPSLRKCVVRRCPTRQPFPERVRVVGQAPLLEARQGQCPHPPFTPHPGGATSTNLHQPPPTSTNLASVAVQRCGPRLDTPAGPVADSPARGPRRPAGPSSSRPAGPPKERAGAPS